MGIGTSVKGADIGRCFDGGAVTVFPEDAATPNHAVSLYNTPWLGTAKPTAKSIDGLFRAGVDNAIAALKSPTLSASAAGGSIKTAIPGPSKVVTAKEFQEIMK